MINKYFDWFRVLRNKDLTSLTNKLSENVLSKDDDGTTSNMLYTINEVYTHADGIG